MDDAKLLDFLKGYASVLQDESWLRDYVPLSAHTNMASARVEALDKNGNIVAIFVTRHAPNGKEFDWCPMMPVNPAQFNFCELFVAAANAVYGDETDV